MEQEVVVLAVEVRVDKVEVELQEVLEEGVI
jgi:hypothetical protein